MTQENRYPGRCGKCGGQIRVGEGIVEFAAGQWRLSHRRGECAAPKAVHAAGDWGLAKVLNGYEFKPDAYSPESQGKPNAVCAICGTSHGVAWISGAGQFLCHRHQDDY